MGESLRGMSRLSRANALTTQAPYYNLTQLNDASSHNVSAFVFIPLTVLAIIGVATFVVIMVLKKMRVDRLRHQLMPLYNFDPNEEADWEAELLQGDKDERLALTINSPDDKPRLKIAANRLGR